MAGEYCGLCLEGFEDRGIPAGSLPSCVCRDRVPIGFDERDNLFVLAEEIPRTPILHCLPLQISNRRDAHLRQSRLRSLVHFDARRRTKFASKQIVHGEAQQLSHLISDARLMKELVAVGTRHLNDVQVSFFSAKIKFY